MLVLGNQETETSLIEGLFKKCSSIHDDHSFKAKVYQLIWGLNYNCPRCGGSTITYYKRNVTETTVCRKRFWGIQWRKVIEDNALCLWGIQWWKVIEDTALYLWGICNSVRNVCAMRKRVRFSIWRKSRIFMHSILPALLRYYCESLYDWLFYPLQGLSHVVENFMEWLM